MDCALELLNEGKRDLLVSAVPDAVANFSQVLRDASHPEGRAGS